MAHRLLRTHNAGDNPVYLSSTGTHTSTTARVCLHFHPTGRTIRLFRSQRVAAGRESSGEKSERGATRTTT